MAFAEDQDVIQTVAPERSDQALSIGVLPGRPWRDRTIANPHRADSTCEGVPVGAVIVAHQIGRCRIPRECLHDLLRHPFRSRVPGYRKPQQLSPSVAKHKKSKQALERRGWDHTEINRGDGFRVTAQECPPSLRRRPPPPDHIFGN